MVRHVAHSYAHGVRTSITCTLRAYMYLRYLCKVLLISPRLSNVYLFVLFSLLDVMLDTKN